MSVWSHAKRTARTPFSGVAIPTCHHSMHEPPISPVEVPFEILLVKRQELPNFSFTNPKYQLGIKAWQHMPLWMTRVFGPRLIGMFP